MGDGVAAPGVEEGNRGFAAEDDGAAGVGGVHEGDGAAAFFGARADAVGAGGEAFGDPGRGGAAEEVVGL